MKWPRVTVRPALAREIPELQARLAEQRHYFEQQDLRETVLYVAEYDGQKVGLCAGRLVWQVEPLMLFPEFQENAPHFAQEKATYMLIRALDHWIASPENATGITQYFCFILKRRMQTLAQAFGMLEVYWQKGSKMFGKNMPDARIGKVH